MIQRLTVWIMIAFIFSFAGCGGSPKTPEQIRQEATKMSAAEIEGRLVRIETDSLQVRQEIQKLKDEVKELPVKELFGQPGQKLKEKLQKLKTREDQLLKQQAIYIEVLHSKQA